MSTTQRTILFLLVLLCFSKAHCLTRFQHKVKHHKTVKPDTRVFIPSHESLLVQNELVDEMGLQRYNDSRELSAGIKRGDLVKIPNTPEIKTGIPEARRYCRPWTLQMLMDLAQDYYGAFHSPLLISSAVRTRQVQRRLLRCNRNAAPAKGETESSHMAGATVDIARRGMSPRQIAWVENYLLSLDVMNMVVVEEELHYGGCFHVLVNNTYWRM